MLGGNPMGTGNPELDLGPKFSSSPCPEHREDPILLKGREGGGGGLLVLQYRPAWTEQAYLRFVNAPHVVRNLPYPSLVSVGPLPALVDGHHMVPTKKIIPHFKSQYPDEMDLDKRLTPSKRCEAYAYSVMIEEQLRAFLRVSQYRDSKNYLQNVRSAVMRAVRFPLNHYVASQERAWAEDDIRVRGLRNLPFSEILHQARAVYATLNERLGVSAGGFFFGSEPTSLDAYLFGHMAEAMTDLHFSAILPSYVNLMSFFRMIHTRYFAPNDNQAKFLQRNNHVNSCNRFNQLEGAILCSEAHYLPEAAAEVYFSKADLSHKRGADAHSKPTQPKTEEEKERQRQNRLWLTIVGGVAAFFLIVEGVASLVIVNQDSEEGGEEE